MCDHKDLNRFEVSAIIGLWRMGNYESIIADILEYPTDQVKEVINTYFDFN